MELLYTLAACDRKYPCSIGHSDSVSVSSSWSKNNIIAFTWQKIVQGYVERYVSIIDPNQPWNVRNISLINSSVTSLKWNETGLKLLCTTSSGSCIVWCAFKNMTNDWRESPAFYSDVNNEIILASAWLNRGTGAILHPMTQQELKDVNLTAKVNRTRQAPCLTQLGGQPMEGYVVVTASGTIAVKGLTQIEQPVSAKSVLSNVSRCLCVADIAFDNNGNIVVMASDGDIGSPVQFWRVQLRYDDDALRLSFECDVMPSILMESLAKDHLVTYDTISHLCFMSSSSYDQVLLCASNSSKSVLEAWAFGEHRDAPINLSFCSQAVMEEKMSKWWKKVATSLLLPKVLCLSLPTVSFSSSTKRISEDVLCNVHSISVLLQNNSIKFLHCNQLHEIYSFHISQNIFMNIGDNESCQKRPYSGSVLSDIHHIELSPMSCALVAFDKRCELIMYKFSPWFQFSEQTHLSTVVNVLVHFLSFCVGTGYEWWDVLLHVNDGIVDRLCEELCIEFHSHCQPLQQTLSSRLLSLEMSIYHRSGMHAKATDHYLRLMFNSITVVFRSLLRPPQNSADDQDPVDKLHEACSTSFENDINKLLQSFDTDQNILQSLQKLIQFIADVALYLLSIVPQLSNGITDMPGVSLIKDSKFLGNLRELLVIIQMWKLLKAACAPTFCGLNDKVDCLPVIFKLITEIYCAISSKEFQGKFPENTVENCGFLLHQNFIPHIDVISPVNGVLQRLTMKNRFKSGKVPFAVNMSSNLLVMENLNVDVPVRIDYLRRMYFGKSPLTSLKWKVCCRCGIVSLFHSVQDSVQKFWIQRFLLSCICGGSWHIKDDKD